MQSLRLFQIRFLLSAYSTATTLLLVAGTSFAQTSIQASVPAAFSGTVPCSNVTGAISMDLTASETGQLASYLSGKFGPVSNVRLVVDTCKANLTGAWDLAGTGPYLWDQPIGSVFGLSFISSTPSYGYIDIMNGGTAFEVDPPGSNLVESGVPPGIPAPTFAGSFAFSKSLSVPIGSQLTMQASAGILGYYNYMPYVVGSWSFTVSANYVCSYQTKTFQQYIADAVNATLKAGQTDDENAADAYSWIIELRSSDAQTSSSNLPLRDAEYFLRGYRGAFVTGTVLPNFSDWQNELYDRGGPIGLLFYNGLKILKGDGIAGAGNFPATPPGGASANLLGWLLGLGGKSLAEAVQSIQNPGPMPKTPSFNEDTPTLPDLQIPLTIEDQTATAVNVAAFYVNTPFPGTISWYDPSLAKGYAWSVYGNRFASVKLSTAWTANLTDIKVSFLTFSFPLSADGTFNFLSVAPTGVDSFVITGTPISTATPDLSIGFSFISAGETLLSSASGDFHPLSAGGGTPIANAGTDQTAEEGSIVTLVHQV
jgi:hypothetical protein